MEFSVGQVVYSKAGRDTKRPFIVLKVENGFLYLADGKLRLVSKPKKKKTMHVQPTNTISNEIVGIIKSRKELKDSDIRAALSEFLVRGIGNRGGVFLV